MASLDDILTTAKNLTQAISTLAQTYLAVQGTQRSAAITGSAVLISTGFGRLAVVDVTTAGSVGAIYDANVAAATTNLLHVIPATVGVTFVNIPYIYGLVVAPGSSQVVTVTFS